MHKVASLLEKGVLENRAQEAIEGDSSPDSVGRQVGRVVFLGDVALARRIGEQIDEHGVARPFGKLPNGFFDADVVVFNLECCISARGDSWEPKPALMRGKPEYLGIFPRGEQCYVANVANNHFLDFGEKGAADTIEALKVAGMLHIGADGELADRQPLVVGTSGGSVALLAFAPCAHRLPGDVRVNVAPDRSREILKAVKQAKDQADVLVVSLHQGVEHCQYTHRASRRLAQEVAKAGADLVIVHHTHVIQGIEQTGESLIFHGIGNFLLDVPQERRPAAAHTLVVRVEIAGRKIDRFLVEPIRMNESWQPEVLEGASRASVFAEIRELSLLLTSRVGVAINDLGALTHWSRHKVLSSWSMVRRVGVRKTASYYWSRLVDRFVSGFI